METQIFFSLSHSYDKMEKKTYFSNFKNVITYELKVFKWEKTRSIPYTYNGWFDFFLS